MRRFPLAVIGVFTSVLTAEAASAADPPPATAPDAELTSDTAAQFYEMRSPTGATVIARRRFMTTLGVAVYDLFDKPHDPLAPTVTFRARLRYDGDYGGSAEETALNSPDRFIPGFSRGPVDLMYGYIEGRRFFKGLLGFRLGRQYVTDALGWWSFDGGLVKVTTPYYLAAEVYGGLEQRGGMPLSTPRFERDGIWRGDRNGFDPALWPSFQPNDVAPAIGGIWIGRCVRIGNRACFDINVNELRVPRTSNQAEDIRAITAAIQRYFEVWIREAPEQFMWSNRRWS
jgi:hypothetical protein